MRKRGQLFLKVEVETQKLPSQNHVQVYTLLLLCSLVNFSAFLILRFFIPFFILFLICPFYFFLYISALCYSLFFIFIFLCSILVFFGKFCATLFSFILYSVNLIQISAIVLMVTLNIAQSTMVQQEQRSMVV